MNYIELLEKFNKKGYSDDSVKYADNRKGGNVLVLKDAEYTYEDEFYGGEPYSGNETIWLKEKPVYRVVYHGSSVGKVDMGELYAFLKKSLAQGISSKTLHRGPESFIDGVWRYENVSSGTEETFMTVETIFKDDELVYEATFIGGKINR